MKKSNKITAIYVISSVLLFLALLIGGTYGIYLSVGINFMRSTVSNVTDVTEGTPSNVSYGGTIDFQPSMIGVIILSVILIVISIFDIISLFKQLIFFKQFKLIRESGLEHTIEKKIKSKSSVIFFAGLINVVSFIAGVVAIFVNATSFIETNMSWVLYVIDGLVVILSVISFVLLIKKAKMNNPTKHNKNDLYHGKNYEVNADDKFYEKRCGDSLDKLNKKNYINSLFQKLNCCETSDELSSDIDQVEYVLLKLKSMKDGKVISNDEYEYLREKLTGLPKKNKRNKNQTKKKIAK